MPMTVLTPQHSALASPVLVTGAGGFIGSHLAERLAETGCKVRAFVHYNSTGRWGWLEESPLRGQMEVIAGDIRDYDSVLAAMRGCQTVFHLAALIGIPYSYASPLAYVRVNVEGAYNILQAARETKPQRVVMTSTSETYGTAQYVPIDEKHPVSAQSPYAATKAAADQLALSFHRSFGVPVNIARPFNTYGPRQSARAIIPTVISQILSGARKVHLGNLSPTRDLTFVRDTVEGFIAVAGCEALVGDVANIGMDEEISIGDLARAIARLMNAYVEIESDTVRERPAGSEVERLRAANAKIRDLTSWQPSHTLETGLRETIAWMQEHLPLYKPDLYSV